MTRNLYLKGLLIIVKQGKSGARKRTSIRGISPIDSHPYEVARQLYPSQYPLQDTKSEMAKRMKTSGSQLERLLDPRNPNILFETVQKAAAAVGKRLMIGLIDTARAA